MRLLVGTSGWQYAHWRRRFYPPGLPQRAWLPFYTTRFDSVELNNSFYRLPERESFEHWAESAPPGFVFAVKASRFLTHVKRLRDPDEPVERLMRAAHGLGPALGPVLLQLPPQMRLDAERLDATLAAFPRATRVAVECRHPSWFVDATRRVLEARGAALCLADRRGPRTPVWATTDWAYLRFHEGRAQAWPGYGRSALATWLERLAGLDGVEMTYAYFNNDPGAMALRDAVVFARLAHRAGLNVSRTPDPRSIETG